MQDRAARRRDRQRAGRPLPPVPWPGRLPAATRARRVRLIPLRSPNSMRRGDALPRHRRYRLHRQLPDLSPPGRGPPGHGIGAHPGAGAGAGARTGVRPYIGDLLDKESVRRAMRRAEGVFHLAAFVVVGDQRPASGRRGERGRDPPCARGDARASHSQRGLHQQPGGQRRHAGADGRRVVPGLWAEAVSAHQVGGAPRSGPAHDAVGPAPRHHLAGSGVRARRSRQPGPGHQVGPERPPPRGSDVRRLLLRSRGGRSRRPPGGHGAGQSGGGRTSSAARHTRCSMCCAGPPGWRGSARGRSRCPGGHGCRWPGGRRACPSPAPATKVLPRRCAWERG